MSNNEEGGLTRYIFSALGLLVIVQATFVVIGILYLEFNIDWMDVSIAVGSAACFELLLSKITGKKVSFPMSALAAGFGIALFFRSSSPWLFALASLLAIGSKYVFKKPNGHVFNPSNFGIVTLVLLFPSQATIEFTQWGGSYFIFVPFALATLFVAYRAKVIHTTLSFFASYTILFFALSPLIFSAYSAHHYGILSPTLMLFASFMITDPRSAPQGTREGIIHGVAIALLFFALEALGFRYAIFLASFIMAILNVFSRLLSPRVSKMFARTAVPFNLTSCVTVLVFLIASVLYAAPGAVGVNPLRIAPDFLFRGVESSQLLSCGPSPAFKTMEGIFKDAGSGYGASWGDYDGDGFDDLFISSNDKPSRLYHNRGDGTFEDVTTQLPGPPLRATSAIFADADNDGNLELFVGVSEQITSVVSGDTTSATQQLVDERHAASLRVFSLKKSGFRDITDDIGLSHIAESYGNNVALSFGDYNNDGYLDFVYTTSGSLLTLGDFGLLGTEKSFADPLFPQIFTIVCNANDVRTRLKSYLSEKGLSDKNNFVETFIGENGCLFMAEGLPLFKTNIPSGATNIPDARHTLEIQLFTPGSVHMFESIKGIRFVERKEFAKLVQPRSDSPTRKVEGLHPYERTTALFYQPVSFDYNRDGLQDIFIATDFGRSTLLKNRGNFSFEDVTASAGLDYAAQAMGVSVADADGNGWMDIYFSNFLNDYLFLNNGGIFTRKKDVLAPLGIGWGASFLDYNMDGKQDLIINNGDVRRTFDIPARALGRSLFRLNTLYKGAGNGSFTDTTWDDLCPPVASGKALAVSDYDNNGTPDVFVGNISLDHRNPGANELYKNDMTGKAFVAVRLHGVKSNRDGIGAVVSVSAAGTQQSQVLLAGNSFNSQNSSSLLFALPEGGPADITVHWPSGITTLRRNVQQNSHIVVTEI